MAPSTRALTAAPRWADVAERGSLTGMRITVWVYRALGRRLAALFALPIVLYFFLTDRRGRRASRAYLARVYATPRGREALAHPPGSRAVLRHYREFALATLDRVGFWCGRADDFEIAFHGREHFAPLQAAQRGAILLGAHVGSFDALRVLADRWAITVNVLMSTGHARRVNRVLRDLNSQTTARVIEVDPTSSRSVFELQACVERGEFVALLGDRVGNGPRTRAVDVEFLGGLASFPAGPFLLANRLDCPVLLMVGVRIGLGAYEIFAEPFADRVRLPRADRAGELRDVVQAYARRLEAYCLVHPYQWFNFYDFWNEEADA